MERIYLTAHVGPTMRQYVEGHYGTDIIELTSRSTFMYAILPHLETVSLNEPEFFLESECVKLALPIRRNEKVYYKNGKSVYVCNTLWRNILTDDGHKMVKKLLYYNYKHSFRTYMAGYVERQHNENDVADKKKRIKVLEGIYAFFLSFGINFEDSKEEKKEMVKLKKDWERFEKESYRYKVSPFII